MAFFTTSFLDRSRAALEKVVGSASDAVIDVASGTVETLGAEAQAALSGSAASNTGGGATPPDETFGSDGPQSPKPRSEPITAEKVNRNNAAIYIAAGAGAILLIVLMMGARRGK